MLTPQKTPGIYGVVHFKNRAVGVLPLDEDENVYMVGQYRYCHDSYEWEIPEGGCPEEESLEACAKRELLEETGIVAESLEPLLGPLQLSNSTTDEVGHLFIARGLSFTQAQPEETEQIRVRKIPFAEALNMALRGEIRDSLTVLALLTYQIHTSKTQNL